MKKILACLLILVLLCSVSVMLFSCSNDDGLKLTYIDDDGNEQTVTIEPTADVDTVAASLMALASKEVDTTQFSSIVLNAAANGVCAGTQKGEAFELTFGANAKIGASIPNELDVYTLSHLLAAAKLYAGVEFTATLPKEVGEDEVPNFCDCDQYAEVVKLYLDESKLYTQLNLSDTALAAIPDLVKLFIDFDSINNKTAYLNLTTIFAMTDIAVNGQVIADLYDAAKSDTASYKATASEIITLARNDSQEYTLKFSDVKKLVEACNIKIEAVDGSAITFSATINQTALVKIAKAFGATDEEAAKIEFDGTVNLTAAIDINTMLDINISATVSNAFTGLFADIPETEEVNVTRQELTITASITTKEALPALTADEKAAATEFNITGLGDLVSLLLSGNFSLDDLMS